MQVAKLLFADDEVNLTSAEGRKPIVAALADAIEADVATRSAR